MTPTREQVIAVPIESYSAEDRAFFAFWYAHMKDDLMQPPLHECSQAVARYIFTAGRERVPMTDEQIRSMCKQEWVFETARQWVHVIESHHGITAQAKKENQTAKRRSASA